MRRALLVTVVFVLAGCSSEDPPPTVKPWDCGPPEPYAVALTVKHHEMCLGDEQIVSASLQWTCDAPATIERDATFTSSDPKVLSIEGDRVRAVGTGAAEIEAHAEGHESEPFLVRVVRCASP